jgi:pyruvate/2-oxoglutarate dehydrogenase complex dihydrolipoamide acyltransferase (E2) component
MSDVTLSDEAWADVEPGTEALVDSWLVREGERVQAGQRLAKVVLIKATLDVEAPAAGVIERILVPKDATFARGQALAVLRPAG